jgi:hypothetical protein
MSARSQRQPFPGQQQRSGRKPKQSNRGGNFMVNAQGQIPVTIDSLKKLKLREVIGFRETNKTVVVLFKPTGFTEVGMTDQPPVLQSIEDVERLAKAPGQIRSEEVLLQKQEKGVEAAIALQRYMDDHKSEIIKISSNYKGEVAMVESKMKFLDENETLLKNNVFAKSLDLKILLLNTIIAIRHALDDHTIDLIIKGKSSMEEHIFQHNVPEYLYGRLSGGRLSNINIDTNLWKIIFPNKISGGATLTLREIRNPAFLSKYRLITTGTDGLAKLLNDDAFLKALIGIDNLSKDNKDWVIAEKLALYLAPIGIDIEDYLENSSNLPTLTHQRSAVGDLERLLILPVAILGFHPLDDYKSAAVLLSKDGIITYDVTKQENDRSQLLRGLKSNKDFLISVPNITMAFAEIGAVMLNLKTTIAGHLILAAKMCDQRDQNATANKTAVLPEVKKFSLKKDDRVNKYLLRPILDDERKKLDENKNPTIVGLIKADTAKAERNKRQQPARSNLTKLGFEVIQEISKDPKRKRLGNNLIAYFKSFANTQMANLAARNILLLLKDPELERQVLEQYARDKALKKRRQLANDENLLLRDDEEESIDWELQASQYVSE